MFNQNIDLTEVWVTSTALKIAFRIEASIVMHQYVNTTILKKFIFILLYYFYFI